MMIPNKNCRQTYQISFLVSTQRTSMHLFIVGSFILSLLSSSPCLSARTFPIKNIPIGSTSMLKPYNYTWKEFFKFLDAKRGSNIKGLSQLKKYFHHFGYLKVQDTNFTDEFDAKFEVALSKYQARLGLSVTRKVDIDTLIQIMSPRCGVHDTTITSRQTTTFQRAELKKTPNMLHANKNYAFFTGLPRWMRTTPMILTYAFSPENSYVPSLTQKEIRDAFKRAFSRWASVIPVTFSLTDDYGFSDIKIGFYSGEHGDSEAFDGVLGVLAHAYSPEIGRFHLDAAERWAVDFDVEKSNVAVDLESVATHEIGHLLGLAHSSDKEAVMYPSLKPREKKVDLKLDDIKGIQALYGTNPNFTIEAFESDISSNFAPRFRISSIMSLLLLGLIPVFFL